MNKDQIKGKVENLKGRVKEAAGALTGDKKTQVEGLGERVQGALHKKAGDVEETITRPAPAPRKDDADDDE
jgi:uncharacterized protein YjbJ (UPF0337 family)